MKYLITIIVLISIYGCAGRADKWVLDKELGKLVLVERLRTVGVGKIDAKFETGGEIETDTGLKTPTFGKVELQPE